MNLLSVKKSIPITNEHKQNPFWSLQNAVDKAMNDFYGLFEPFNFPSERFERLSLIPSVDIIDDDLQFKVEMEMPGIGEEDIKVSINHGILVIRGEKTTSKHDKDKSYRIREINYGSYERSIPLPDTVDIDSAKASFKKGMLWVTFSKKSEFAKKSRNIEVTKA